jgi:hypothetical protein
VAEVLPLSESELDLLESLIRHQVRFLVVDLSAAALQGAPVVTEDVDLWFEDLHDPKLLRALREVGAGYVPPFGNNPPMLAGRHSEPFDLVISMSGLRQFADEFECAVVIPVGRLRLKVLPLDRILASKTAANRPKDRLVIPLLRNTLRTLQVMQTSRPEKLKGKRSKPKPKVGKRS